MKDGSIDKEFAGAIAKFIRLDQRFAGDFNQEELGIQLGFPEFQELVQDREPWGYIKLLPDVTLKEGGMVGQAVDDLRRG